MTNIPRLATVLLLSGMALIPVACGESKTGKNGKPAIQTAKEAPAQPTKPVKKTDEEWKNELTPEQYDVLRKNGTERAFGKVYDEFKHQGSGTYYCAGCDAKLFSSDHKFDASCGWPAFYDVASNKSVKSIVDTSAGMKRIEVRCASCDGHLGHIFEGEGFNTPTDQRYCINGIVLKFVPDKEEDSEKKAPAKEEKDSKEKE
tara:strand:- start:174 stop:779 length:606 start_codon:yes stop_codon:yes gene_type:complete